MTRMEEIWRQNSDSLMLEFWILRHPINFLSVISITVVSIFVLLPKLVSQYQDYFAFRDLRPLMIIYNGLFFGAFGAGIPLAYFATKSGADFFACSAHETERTDPIAVALSYLSVMFLYFMLLDMGFFVIRVLRGGKLSNSELAHNLIWTVIMYTTMAIHPTGSTIFAAWIHMLARISVYGYLVLRVPSSLSKRYLPLVHGLEISANGLIVLHHLYYLTLVRSCGNHFTLCLTCAYCAVRACLLTRRFRVLHQTKRQTDKSE